MVKGIASFAQNFTLNLSMPFRFSSFYLASFLLFICGVSSGQILRLEDSETGEPIEFSTISSGSKFSVTNNQGQADISDFHGEKEIEIRNVSYRTLVKSYDELSALNFMVSLEKVGVSLDQIVVSASRWNQPTREIPARITTMTSKDIAFQLPQTSADLLGNSGEVYIQKSQLGGGSPMIRGFSTNRLLISVDGIRMNTAIFRSGNLQNIISLDPFATESAEVLFGPGSVIYGSDAIGGVMSFQTLKPEFSLTDKALISGKGSARYSTAATEKTIHGDVKLGWSRLGFVTSFTATDYGDLKMGSNGPEEYLRDFYVSNSPILNEIVDNSSPRIQRHTGYSQFNLMQKVRYAPSPLLEFNYGFHFSETSDIPRYDRLLRTENGLPRSSEWYYGPQSWMMNNLNIDYKGSSKIYDRVAIKLAVQNFGESRVDRDFMDSLRNERIEEVKAFSVNIDFTKSLGKNRFNYGFEGVKNDVDSKGSVTDITTEVVDLAPARYPKSSWSSFAIYMTNQYRMNDEVLLQSGVRYNYFSLKADFTSQFFSLPFSETSIFRSSVTGSVGLVYNPTSNLSLSTNLSSGFRAPNVDDIGKIFDSEPGSVVVPNPALSAEYAYNADVGIARVFGDRIKFDATGYFTYLTDALVRRDYSLNGITELLYDGELSNVQAIQNAALARVYGIQTGVEMQFSSGFGVISRYNWQRGREELDDGTESASRHAAPAFGITRISFKTRKIRTEVYAVYNAEKPFSEMPESEKSKVFIYATDENGDPFSPSWYSLNWKGTFNISEVISISSGLENITNQRYRPYSSGIVASGANFILSLNANF